MSEEHDNPAWLLEPPGSNEIHFHIETGDGVELTPAARQALEELVAELSGNEVNGFQFGIWDCDELTLTCQPDNCTLNNCQPLTGTPFCYVHSHCRIIFT